MQLTKVSIGTMYNVPKVLQFLRSKVVANEPREKLMIIRKIGLGSFYYLQ